MTEGEIGAVGPEQDVPTDASAHLLRNPENARRLMASIERLESGGGEAHDLLD